MAYLLTIFLILGIICFALYIYRFFSKPKKGEQQVINVPIFQLQPEPQPEEDYYGPVPTHEQRRITLNRFVEFFKQFPESPLKDSYPQQANMARALIRYSELELLLQSGHITQEAYDVEVEHLLPLIDISEDIPPAEK